jgi:hypothetical protein
VEVVQRVEAHSVREEAEDWRWVRSLGSRGCARARREREVRLDKADSQGLRAILAAWQGHETARRLTQSRSTARYIPPHKPSVSPSYSIRSGPGGALPRRQTREG